MTDRAGAPHAVSAHRERLVRRLALRGLLFLALAEFVALALRGIEVVVTGRPPG
jgi:hypothetical protein